MSKIHPTNKLKYDTNTGGATAEKWGAPLNTNNAQIDSKHTDSKHADSKHSRKVEK